MGEGGRGRAGGMAEAGRAVAPTACGDPPPGRRWQRLLDAGSLCLLALYLALAVPASAARAFRQVREAVHRVREPVAEARARVFGADFVAGVERIRAALATTEPYLLIDGGDPQEGAALWVRYELAPRRALFIRDPRAGDLDWLRRQIPRTVRWVVVAAGGRRPPELYRRYQYFRERGEAR